MSKVLKILLLSIITLHTPSFAETYEHPESLYNKAIDAYNQQDLGAAMSYTKKAFLLSPSNTKIRELLYRIRQDIGVPSLYTTDSIFERLFAQVFYSMPPQATGLIGSILFLIFSVLTILLLLKKFTLPKSKFILTSGFFCSLLLITISLVHYYTFFKKDIRILIEVTQTYEEPSLQSTKLNVLPAGSEVTVIEATHDNALILVRSLDGRETWISTNTAPLLFQ